MNNQQILEKAIQKAVEGGWKPFGFGTPTRIEEWHDEQMIEVAVVFPLHESPVSWVRELEGIIFNHDFAKALWGDEKSIVIGGSKQAGRLNPVVGFPIHWQYHLQQMVIAEDPIKYLGENI